MKVADLKKCPCCGGKAEIDVDYEQLIEWVECTQCGLSTPGYENRGDAKIAWNRRVKKIL